MAETGGVSGAVLDALRDTEGRDADDAALRGTGDELADGGDDTQDDTDDTDDDGDTDDTDDDGDLEPAGSWPSAAGRGVQPAATSSASIHHPILNIGSSLRHRRLEGNSSDPSGRGVRPVRILPRGLSRQGRPESSSGSQLPDDLHIM